MIEFELLHPEMTPDHLGLLPYMLDADSPISARDQFDANYQHGGGWRAFRGHTLNADNTLSYPGDPDLIPVARTRLRDELIIVYDHAWVAILQPDRSFEVCRMD